MRCSSCKRELPGSEFPPSVVARGRGWCRACSREAKRRVLATPEGLEAAREARREASRRYYATPEGREARREAKLRSKYGLTEETLATMLAAQGGRCAICGTTEPGGIGTWQVDHDHSCCPSRRVTCGGKCIRGLLCQRCNVGLGQFRDNAETLRVAADYLEHGRAHQW